MAAGANYKKPFFGIIYGAIGVLPFFDLGYSARGINYAKKFDEINTCCQWYKTFFSS